VCRDEEEATNIIEAAPDGAEQPSQTQKAQEDGQKQTNKKKLEQ
jgi:hypothetical protein